MVRVKVLYFGQAREAAGGGGEDLSLTSPAYLDDLFSETARRHEKLNKVRKIIQVAVNEELKDGNIQLKDGDVVAFLPPVAGG
jgi:molybdopterin converting factor subunit 1